MKEELIQNKKEEEEAEENNFQIGRKKKSESWYKDIEVR